MIQYLGGAFPIGKLSEGHTKELVQAGERFHMIIAAVPIYTTTELVHGQKVHQLRKYQSS